MLEMLRLAVTGARRNRRHVGICGEAPANYPEIARFLAGLGIDSISVNPASLLRTFTVVHEADKPAAGQPESPEIVEPLNHVVGRTLKRRAKIVINSFGRIGRLVLRALARNRGRETILTPLQSTISGASRPTGASFPI